MRFPLPTPPLVTLLVSLLSSSLTSTLVAQTAAIVVKPGARIAFLGDSITQGGARAPGGYCRLVVRGLAAVGIEAKMIPAGISGHKSNQMLARLERDVLAKKPDWMTLSCGVNDVWHGKRGVPLEQYKANITAIVERAQAQGIKVMILTSTMIHEDQGNDLNQQLRPYNAFLRRLAAERKCRLADLSADMQAALVEGARRPRGNQLTTDGVHMNALGNIMMALGVLRTLGLSDIQLERLRGEFEAIPDTFHLRLNTRMSATRYQQLRAVATKAGVSVQAMLEWVVRQRIDALLEQK